MDLIDLAKLYLSLADSFCKKLAKEAGTNKLLSARNKKAIPSAGMLGHTEYSFHGIGCLFTHRPPGSKEIIVDVDFVDGDGNWKAFDAWRLYLFGKSIGSKKYSSLMNVSVDLLQLQLDSLVVRSKRSKNFYYLVEDYERLQNSNRGQE